MQSTLYNHINDGTDLIIRVVAARNRLALHRFSTQLNFELGVDSARIERGAGAMRTVVPNNQTFQYAQRETCERCSSEPKRVLARTASQRDCNFKSVAAMRPSRAR
eukprot:1060783-Pleurochrysis_carterae.AAC.1